MSEVALSKRVSTAAALVRRGACLADVGTDHAYLPIYLLEQGLIARAVLSDVNVGPLEKARENVSRHGLCDSVSFVLGSGAHPLRDMGATDYTVCGMGGELIAAIIDEAPHLKSADVNLVLQPMSKPELLRKYLWDSGFSIYEERYSTDEGKHYVCFGARYTGLIEEYTDSELYFGKHPELAVATSAGREYVEARLASLEKIRAGRVAGGMSAEKEREIIETVTKTIGI